MANDITSVLGKTTAFTDRYSPEVLAREPRIKNREIYGLKGNEFYGVDVWNAYEASFLLNNGAPFNGVLKLIIPSHSEFIVESKSLKLYLFSFMMEKLGDTEEGAIQKYVRLITQDLNSLLETVVQVRFFKPEEVFMMGNILQGCENLDSFLPLISTDVYSETPSLLEAAETDGKESLKVYSHSLRSNCKITHQPDFGSVLINMKGEKLPTYASLLKYIISFRNENHFHEEIVECIFARLTAIFNPEELTVTAYYTRRGGIDINPIRSNVPLLPSRLTDINDMSYRMTRS